MPIFPEVLDNFTPKENNVDDVVAEDINELQTAIEAIEAKLGINGSTDPNSIDYKLANHDHDADYAAIGHDHSGVYAPALGVDDNYVTDAEKTKLANLSGTNTGDQTLPVKASGAEIIAGTDDAKFATAKALADAGITPGGGGGSCLFYIIPYGSSINPSRYVIDSVNSKIYTGSSNWNSYFKYWRYNIENNVLINNPGRDDRGEWLYDDTNYDGLSNGGAVIGSYMYIWARKRSNTTFMFLRITLSTGVITEMTLSGTGPTQGDTVTIFGDGTYVYALNDDDSTQVRKYTVSGTTITNANADITLPDKAHSMICTNGTYIWFLTDSADNTKNYCLYKTNMSGTTQTTKYLNEVVAAVSNNATLFIYGNYLYYMGSQTLGNSSTYNACRAVLPIDKIA